MDSRNSQGYPIRKLFHCGKAKDIAAYMKLTGNYADILSCYLTIKIAHFCAVINICFNYITVH
ncbi:protein of unknown function [Candidatus Nitrotoga arctica]|uniref:Uncharacterized protein n=1 Tax=Candidatus Nitrotoga arctica TaxID=453162 RepID=A0ABM8Z340_9PROT|nr:protein of unknown function [Candidatus Nitrotoga arctica]